MSPDDQAGEDTSAASQLSPSSRPWWRHPATIPAVAVLVISAVVVAVQHRPPSPAVTRTTDATAAPDFSVPDLRDEVATVDLRARRGRPVVLNFWASWCVPCRKEMPVFEAVHRMVGEKVAFVGMNNEDARGDALGVLRETGVTYSSGFDPRGQVAKAYGLRGMPTTIFISADGRILGSHAGEMSEGQLKGALRDLFGVATPA